MTLVGGMNTGWVGMAVGGSKVGMGVGIEVGGITVGTDMVGVTNVVGDIGIGVLEGAAVHRPKSQICPHLPLSAIAFMPLHCSGLHHRLASKQQT